MKRIIFLFVFGIMSLASFGQIYEPEFTYECGILLNDTSLIICEKQQGKVTGKASASMYLTGIGKVKSRYQIPGHSSPIRIKKSDKVVLICRVITNTIDPNQVINVYQLEQKSKYRQVQIGKIGTFTGSEIGANKITFAATKYGNSSYKIEINNLPCGEYAVTVLNPMLFSCFAIEE